MLTYIDSIAGDYSACPALFLGLVHRECFFFSSGVLMVMVVRMGSVGGGKGGWVGDGCWSGRLGGGLEDL